MSSDEDEQTDDYDEDISEIEDIDEQSYAIESRYHDESCSCNDD